jgi:hypothetical protein
MAGVIEPRGKEMTIFDALRKVAPELNLIYTVPPFDDGSGPDFGWFCREHAFHTHLICAAMGVQSCLVLGDFGLSPLRVADPSSEQHAWCAVKEVAPVDLSMTFVHFSSDGSFPQLEKAVIGTGQNGQFSIIYGRSAPGETGPEQFTITFVESRRLDLSPTQLIADPYRFLHAPVGWDAWKDFYGADIYSKITLHCLEVASRRVKPVEGQFHEDEAALEWIAQRYNGATDKLFEMMTR